MIKSLLNYFDFRYYLKFALLFVSMYCCYTFVIGVTTPGGSYYPFFDNYLNFPILIRISVLNGAKFILHILGFDTFVNGDTLLSHDGFKAVRMGWPCYGMMINSFWLAYVLAHSSPLKRKLIWSFAGILSIYLLNCIRVSLMMVAMEKYWTIGKLLSTNNHDLFNYLSYIIIILMIIMYNRQSEYKTPDKA